MRPALSETNYVLFLKRYKKGKGSRTKVPGFKRHEHNLILNIECWILIYELQLLACAEDDISTAVLWYEKQMNGLGHFFILSINATIQSIQKNPFIQGYLLSRLQN